MRNRFFSGYTGIIIIANIVMFIIYMILSYFYGPIPMSHMFAIQPSMILQGRRLWTFFTSMFLHASIGHLAANMISLIFMGGFVERIIGKKRFLWLYFAGGIAASIFFIFFASFFGTTEIGEKFFGSPNSLAVGASGAIFAIVGLLTILIPKMRVLLFFIIPMPLWVAMVGLTFVMWMLSATLSLPIGNTAHLGGLLIGVAYGIYMRKKYPRKIKLLSRYFG